MVFGTRCIAHDGRTIVGARRGTTAPHRHRKRLAAAVMVLPLFMAACHGNSATSAAHSLSAGLPNTWPKCGTFHPITNVPPSVPVLGSGEAALGWGTAHPLGVSTGGTGTVVCINWKYWGAPISYGQGWGEVSAELSGARLTRWVARIELRASDLGHCKPDGHLAYTRLYLKQPSAPGRNFGPWTRWAGSGQACYP